MPMEMPPTSAKARAAFDRVAEGLAPSGVGRGAMFGMPCLKARGKAFAGLWGDSFVFKLTGDDHAAGLALKGAALFDPSGMDRPMKEWVVVPLAHAKRWDGLARAALDYVP
jgi:hypothetical protein